MTAFDHTIGSELMDVLTALSVTAALAIRRVSATGKVQQKADGSPVTAADQAADETIRYGLARLAPAIPVISEEQAEYTKPPTGHRIILVDPLDGTRDFIAGRDEYTVNIALMEHGVPVLGVISAPALGLLWRGIVGRGAERMEFAGDGARSPPHAIQTRRPPPRELIVMVSRSHIEARTQGYLDNLPQPQIIPCGSSLKFCRVAEGAADHYPRLAPTRDWDVAAGHAILAAAGGSVTAPEGGPVRYGTAELRILGFMAWGQRDAATTIKG